MNIRTLPLIAILAAVPAMSASALALRITGSPTYRAAVNQGIKDILKPGFIFAYTGNTLDESAQAIFSGVLNAPGTTLMVIKTSWTTSGEGIDVVTNGNTVATFLDSSTLRSGGGTANCPTVYETAVTADMTVTEVLPQTMGLGSLPGNVDKVEVGILPYVWVRNRGCPSTFSNINPRTVQTMLRAGTAGCQFSGSPADTDLFLPLGLSETQGTRYAGFAEIAFGGTPNHWQISTSMGSVSDIVQFPAQTTMGVSRATGESGYATPADMVTALNVPGSISNPSNPAYVVGCLDVSAASEVLTTTQATATASLTGTAVSSVSVTAGGADYCANPQVILSGGGGSGAVVTATVNSSGVITGFTVVSGGTGYTTAPSVSIKGGAFMDWCGIPYSPAAVRLGTYTLWSYERVLFRNDLGSAAASSQLADRIRDYTSSLSGIPVEEADPGNVYARRDRSDDFDFVHYDITP